jgi:hypothetical protein
MSVPINDEKNVSNRQIFEVFVYGGLAHMTADKKVVYDRWKTAPLFEVIELEFCHILETFLQGIFLVAKINKKALEELSS